MTVVSMVVGAVADTTARVVTKVTSGSNVRLAVAANPDMASPVFFGPATPDAQNVATVTATGLAPATRWWWQVEHGGVLDTALTGQFRTHPTLGLPASFRIGVTGDAGLSPIVPGTGTVLATARLSNAPIFDLIRTRALAEDWLLLQHLGDMHYYDLGSNQHGIIGGGSLANYRAGYDDVLTQPRQHQLYHEVPWNLLWDDHDYGPNNSDGTLAGKGNAATAHRERAPHYPLPDADGAIYHTFTIGRVLFVGADTRFHRSPNSDLDTASKTMLGAAQKAWMDDLLGSSTAKVLVWLMPGQWKGTGEDTWGNFTTERAELVQLFGDHGWLGRMCIIGADAHMVALDTGGGSAGSIPVLQAAALDADPTGDPGLFDLGGQSGREQYGTLDVADLGSRLVITLTGWQNHGLLVTHSFTVEGDPPPPVAAGGFTRALTGSHRATFEARVLTTFQTGNDPAGTTIPILDGDVQLDGTAEVQRTLELTTEGAGLFPRAATDLLAPYGTELFVSRGVDFGGQVIRVPLGYFRLNVVEQDDAPNGPVRLSGQDRMAGIVDGRLTEPRVFEASRTVAGVFAELVGEIYPAATVLFDDNTGMQTLGRQVIAEESRYEMLHDMAEAHGKVMFWDGDGILRVQDAPDPASPVWTVAAGHLGVQLQTGRMVTREGVYNGVVATGEGAGSDGGDPVRAVAVDANPNSPTFWGGRFGRVPRFFSSPLMTNAAQAATAARNMLRRSIGMPYQVDFRAVPNPSLLPYDPIQIILADGNRELHIVETLTIPLDAESAMTGTTREQTLIQIGV